ncbi:hypothetical protein VMCG_09514 [Cytospora schulzeri]|uniref:DNA endonuclease activator Ctp1 C-terminal domain-containing protein n=1 Tax=Cytospora schulzeri TaxID=448051 RepID=A0A423VFW4_9PEZI|nr:hypothetical protein VMCG_09514 [Valsa malicola]
MSTWLERGRSAIQEALAAELDKIDEDLELQERDRKHNELLKELQQLRTRAAKVDRLQQENESLKEEIQRFRQTEKDRGLNSINSRQVLGELSPNKSLNPGVAKPQAQDVNATSDLQNKYNKLTAKYKALGQSRDEYRSKLRQRIEEIDRWAESVDSRDKLIGSLRNKLAQAQSRQVASGSSETRSNETNHGEPVDDEPLDIAAPVPKRPTPNPATFEQPTGADTHTTLSLASTTHACTEPILPPIAQSHLPEGILKESTDEDGGVDDNIELPRLPEHRDDEPIVAIKVELSSDGPVFVSERSVRKRKHDSEENSGNKRLQRIKSEHSSSGPECVGEAHNFAPTESLDFEEEAHFPTPRKRRDLSHDRLQDQDTDAGSTTEPGLPDIMRRETTVPSAAAGAPRTMAPGPGLSPSTYNYSVLLKAPGRQSRPLTPRDQQQYKSRNAFQLDIGVRDLADDGDAGSDTVQRPVARSLLGALLDSPSVRTPPPIIRPGPSGAKVPGSALSDGYEDFLKVPAPRELPHGKKYTAKSSPAAVAQKSTVNTLSPKTTAARERPPKKPSILRDDMPRGRSADREKVPLRNKPMDKLRPEDFKPNPRYNDGLTYVYDEVNRGMTLAERAALSGCTDPNCCGKTFRSFAEAERSALGASVATRSEDIKLLEEYLGDDAYKLGSMTREEKEETWLQAKTWELANKFGRHRQRYTRMPSPPGFWAVDFPNTQERAEERRQAEEIRKALVHERYREAMRAARIRRTQHPHDPSNLPRIRRPAPIGLGRIDHLIGIHPPPGPHERRVLDPPLDAPLELVRVGRVHGALDGARVDGVDGGALGQLAGPDAGHGLDGGLGPAVDGLPQEATVGADGGEVDDAPGPVGGQVRLRGLHEEEGPQDVDAVGEVEVGDLEVGQLVVLGDAGVVDQDVDLELVVGRGRGRGEVFPRGLDEGPGALRGAQVGLHAEGLDAVF